MRAEGCHRKFILFAENEIYKEYCGVDLLQQKYDYVSCQTLCCCKTLCNVEDSCVAFIWNQRDARCQTASTAESMSHSEDTCVYVKTSKVPTEGKFSQHEFLARVGNFLNLTDLQ